MASRSYLTRLAAGLVLSVSPALVFSGCSSETESWTPYERPEGSVVMVNGNEVDMYTMPDDVGCVSCHAGSHDPHPGARTTSCTGCHGGDGDAVTIERAHPKPTHPEWWPEGGANPERIYSRSLEENYAWIRFVNPGDLRVANQSCGPCHPDHYLHVSKSVMTTASHFWGVAPYANGVLPNKYSIMGESHSPEGIPQAVFTVPAPTQEQTDEKSIIPFVVPLPNWEVGQTANVFRVFEKGSRLGAAALGFNGLPIPLIGLPDKLEDPGRPNNRLSDRGLGTLNRVDLPLLNLFKTRLNDPFLSFLGTNDHAGDYRSAGCTACHMVYANDRSPVGSGPYAKFGNRGKGNASEGPWGDSSPVDPTLSDASGHPIQHEFTRAIPSSQCMVCHHHQPNSFVNSYLGFTMWTYETDGEEMWPDTEQNPTIAETFERLMHNPEAAAIRGKWGDREFLSNVSDLNPELEHTQFADYHGHGWIFRAIMKTDRKGNLLDTDGNKVAYDTPGKFTGNLIDANGKEVERGASADEAKPPFKHKQGRAVHMMDIHAERGMHCVDCHFTQDSHGDGNLYAEYQAQVEIMCQDCHGDMDNTAADDDNGRMLTSGPASKGTTDLLTARTATTPWDERRFEQRGGELIQRSMLYPDLEWTVPQIKSGEGDGSKADKAHFQKSFRSSGGNAHTPDTVECYTCHTAWITSCFGCHLPQEANWKTPTNHFSSKELRNYATYNPQAVRDAEFMLGVAGNVKGNTLAPVRSSSALLISSVDAQRQRIYGQVPTIAANGMSSQAFNTHFPHTVRTTETRDCTDCHLSKENDNNAWLAQTYLLGTNYVNFMGHNVFVGEGGEGFEAIRVTEWDEPQAIYGSRLHEMAFPERYRKFVEEQGRELDYKTHHGGTDIQSLQLRGEYLFTASGPGGFRVYDVANVNNKGFSEKVVTAPFSPIGHDTHVATKFATAVALPTNNHITMSRKFRPENKETPYMYKGEAQNMHESYRYAYISDRYEGLVIVDVDTMHDWDPQNNFLERALTFNPDGVLDGAENLTVAGTTLYVCCANGVVAIDIDDPLQPRVIAQVGAPDIVEPTSIGVQFRYAFVTDSEGLKVIDVTHPAAMEAIPSATVEIADARDVYVSRTYAYVSGGAEGLVIVDIEKAESPFIDQVYTADGKIGDLNQTMVATTNDSVYAYLADGRNGFHIIQVVTPEDGGRSAYGFSPRPRPQWISSARTDGPALALSEGLDRDRAVDESGNQMAVFGRIGGRPMNLEEMKRLYLTEDGEPYATSTLRGSASAQPTKDGPEEGAVATIGAQERDH